MASKKRAASKSRPSRTKKAVQPRKRASAGRKALKKAQNSRKKLLSREIDPHSPFWHQPGAAKGSAVRYIASLSSRFNWVGIYELKGKILELGPFIGAPTGRRSRLVVLVRDPNGKTLGQIEVGSQSSHAFDPDEERAVKWVAEQLGELWHE